MQDISDSDGPNRKDQGSALILPKSWPNLISKFGLGSGLSAIDTFAHREYLDEINLSFTLCVANRPSGGVYRLAINAS
jgi:hypothetical protein